MYAHHLVFYFLFCHRLDFLLRWHYKSKMQSLTTKLATFAYPNSVMNKAYLGPKLLCVYSKILICSTAVMCHGNNS